MKNKMVRELYNMPIDIKLEYCNLLFMMAGIDGRISSSEMTELYRLMANIRPRQGIRISLLTHMDEGDKDIKVMVRKLFEGLSFQEKNIVRFSLIKDLMIVMRADHYESPEEKELFGKLKDLLRIRDEQLSLIEDEYRNDREFSDYEIEETQYNKKVKEAITLVTSLGLPAALLYFKEEQRYNNYGLKDRFKRKNSKKDILKALALGVISYKTVKWWLNRKTNQGELMKEYILKDCMELQERAVDYLYRDMNYVEGYLQYIDDSDVDSQSVKNKVILLKKSLSQLETGGPRLI